MIVDCALYRNGDRVLESHSLPRIAAAAREDPDAFVWMGLHEPSPSDLVGVARLFGLHPLAVEDAQSTSQRPKLDCYEGTLFLSLRTVWWEAATESIETGEIRVIAGPDYVVTVRHGTGSGLEGVRRRLEESHRLGQQGPAAVLHAVVDAVVDGYLDIVDDVEDAVDDVEARVFGPERYDDSPRMYRLKREVHEFYRAVAPLVDPVTRLADDPSVPLVDAGLRPFFSDVRDHLLRARELVETYERQLGDIVQAYLAQVSVRQNEDMRRISAYVAIFGVLTLVAGIYGMNFEHMPELRWRYGYPFALLLMGGVSVVMYRLFKRSGWL
nr:magnesium/cobalt transporter CorA [Vallicoccus soli]